MLRNIMLRTILSILYRIYNVIIDRAKFASAQDWSGTDVIVIKKQHFFILYNIHTPFLARVLNNNNARHDEYIHNIRYKTSWIGIIWVLRSYLQLYIKRANPSLCIIYNIILCKIVLKK